MSFISHTFLMSNKKTASFWSEGFKDCFLKVIKKKDTKFWEISEKYSEIVMLKSEKKKNTISLL